MAVGQRLTGMRKKAHAERLKSLVGYLHGLGFKDNREDAEHAGFDLFMSRGNEVLGIVLRDAPDARLEHLRSRLADALLTAAAACALRDARGATPVALVAAPHVTTAMAERLADEFKTFRGAVSRDDVGWGIVDDEGVVCLHVAGVNYRRDAETAARRSAIRAFDPFSDRGQWVLKVLVASRLPESLINGVYREHTLTRPLAQSQVPRHAYQLGPKAGVSTATADRIIRWLKLAGHIDEGGSDLSLHRLPELLTRWRGRHPGPGAPIPAMWRQRPQDARAHLHERLRSFAGDRHDASHATVPAGKMRGIAVTQPRACLASFSACEALGISVVMGVVPRLYVEHPHANFDKLGLRPARPTEPPDVLVFAPPNPESIFRPCIARDRVPAADVIQCWLDLAHERARGEEQSQALVAGPLAALFADSAE